MRVAIMPLLLALSACGSGGDGDGGDATGAALGSFSDGERSGFCSRDDGSVAFILYDDDSDANCMAEGRVEGEGGELAFVPRGDEQCRIPMTLDGDALAFGALDESCRYYCGGDTELEGRRLSRGDATGRALSDPSGAEVC